MFLGIEPLKWRNGLIVAAVTIVSVGAARLIGSADRFQPISRQSQDAHFLLRGPAPASGIVLVVVDKKALGAFREPVAQWRKYYAKAIAASARAGAAAVGLVVVPARPLPDLEQEWALAEAAELASRTMPGVCSFPAEREADASDPLWSVPIIQWAEDRNRLGFSNPQTDGDDFVRRWQLIGEPDPALGLSPSFALLLAAVSRHLEPRWTGKGELYLGTEIIPLDK